MKNTWITASLFSLLSGCAFLPPEPPPVPPKLEHSAASQAEIADAKKKVLQRISDPESAKFETLYKFKVTYASGKVEEGVCGYVNFRGPEGGYDGFTKFFVSGKVVSYYGDHMYDMQKFLNRYCTRTRL